MILKPQDVLILLWMQVHYSEEWSYPRIAGALFLSLSEAHGGVKRAASARLLDMNRRKPLRKSLEEFLIHGVRYAFPPTRGGQTRGMPTCYAAPPLSLIIASSGEDVPVWPDPEGTIRGYSFSPLYRTVPAAARIDRELYEWLALIDTIRDGRARETELAIRELEKRFSKSA